MTYFLIYFAQFLTQRFQIFENFQKRLPDDTKSTSRRYEERHSSRSRKSKSPTLTKTIQNRDTSSSRKRTSSSSRRNETSRSKKEEAEVDAKKSKYDEEAGSSSDEEDLKKRLAHVEAELRSVRKRQY